MKRRLDPTPAHFAFNLILAILVYFPDISCQETRPFDVCGISVECGRFRLDYPFWGSGRPAYCGHPGFELSCQNNVTTLYYQLLPYQVLDMNNRTQTVTIARDDLWNDYCLPSPVNTSYNTTLFNFDNSRQQNISLYYNCTALKENLHQFSCFSVINKSDSIGGNIVGTNNQIGSSTTGYLDDCRNHIDVPVDNYLASRLALPSSPDVDIRLALMAGFNLRWMAKNFECDECIRSKGRCGSNSTLPELFACYCDNGNFSLTCNHSHRSRGLIGSPWKLIIIGCSCVIVVIMTLLFVIFYQTKRVSKAQKTANHHIETFIRNHGALAAKRYKYSEIKKITNSFIEKLGQGGYGSVFKGQLPNGHQVAVKLLDGVTGNGQDFINEVGSISRTSHVNIVTLLGFCLDGKKSALVYEFMPNGSLDKFLCHDGSRLDWYTLFQIAKGIARGLEYLHRGCNTSIVHFDIKPHNILLDEEFVPKISDFGLAKLCKSKESIVSVTGARGTAGYIAPEVFFRSLGGASHKSDVYSYGMMVLEMTGARKDNITNSTDMSAAYFPDTIYKKVEGGENLGVDGVTTKEEDELARKMVMVSLWCIQSDPSDRPSISKVVEMLEGSFQSLEIPPKRFWSSPTRYSQRTSTSATQSSTNERVLTMHTARKDFSS